MMVTAQTRTKSVLMLHGGPGFYGYMSSLGQRLPKHHDVTYFAQRGSLANPKPLDELTLEAHLRDIDDEIGRMPTDQDLCLVGHSWGANLALLYAAQNPDKLNKVVAIAPAPLTMESAQKFEANLNQRMSPTERARSDELELTIRSAFEAGTFDETSQDLANERLNLAVPYYHYDSTVTEQLAPVRVDFQSFIASQNGLWEKISGGTIPQCLAKVSVPLLLIQGVDDPIPYLDVAENLKNHIPELQHSTFKNCGHFPWLEPASTVESVAAIVQFIDS